MYIYVSEKAFYFIFIFFVSLLSFFFVRVIKFSKRMFTYVAHFDRKSRDLYSNKVVSVRISQRAVCDPSIKNT